MNAKHLFLTLTMLLASFTFAWSETVTDVISFSTVDAKYGADWSGDDDYDPEYNDLEGGFVPNPESSGVSYSGKVWYDSDTKELGLKRTTCISSTSEVGLLQSVTVTWSSSTASGRGVKVYGKNTPYDGTETYSTTGKLGDLLGSLTYDGENNISTLNVTAEA